MFPRFQLFLTCVAARAFAQNSQQTTVGYQDPGYGRPIGPAVGTPYQEYADFAGPPQPYSTNYDIVDELGNRQYRSEQGDANNVKTGSYGYTDVYGLYRRVNYIADANGFRATVDTNEPGTAPGASADVVFNAAPVVPPVPGGTAASASFGAARYGAPGYSARASIPGYNNGYGRYGAYGAPGAYGGYGGYGPTAVANGAYGYGGFGRSGYAPYGQGLGGYGNGGYARPNGYGSAFGAGRYGAAGYGGFTAGYPGYRRR
ncbi:hypothetical protein HPB51_008143 [Rhipicephalus microplus]|uniref:Cuticle protein n=1 Tax=Rhipicephalus microplus TaxID=6941 RepID=A0A9J6D4G8_RHIMP|nr:shematrin-like protein 1 [Rhipicephalus microplus]KAH8008952.1 hypothetical protein HPB51_008143 [Rhipicephalus microplus]